MNSLLNAISDLLSGIVIKAVIAFALCGIYAFGRMWLLGEDSSCSTLESLLLLFGSVIISDIIVKKLLGR